VSSGKRRIRATCAIAGSVSLFVGTYLHPMQADPNDAVSAFTEYAADQYLYCQGEWQTPVSRVGLALVAAGALGNLYERLLVGAVVDYLDVFLGPYHWPAFNLADSAICVGVGLLLWTSVRHPPPVKDDKRQAAPPPGQLSPAASDEGPERGR